MILSKLLVTYAAVVTRPNQAEVYFIRDVATRTVKIGKTGIGNSAQRLKQLQTGNPNTLTLVRTIPTRTHSEAYKLEKILHRDHSGDHYRGEWFKY